MSAFSPIIFKSAESGAENFQDIGVARIQVMLTFEPLDGFSNFKKVKSLEFYQEFKNIGVASATPRHTCFPPLLWSCFLMSMSVSLTVDHLHFHTAVCAMGKTMETNENL